MKKINLKQYNDILKRFLKLHDEYARIIITKYLNLVSYTEIAALKTEDEKLKETFLYFLNVEKEMVEELKFFLQDKELKLLEQEEEKGE